MHHSYSKTRNPFKKLVELINIIIELSHYEPRFAILLTLLVIGLAAYLAIYIKYFGNSITMLTSTLCYIAFSIPFLAYLRYLVRCIHQINERIRQRFTSVIQSRVEEFKQAELKVLTQHT